MTRIPRHLATFVAVAGVFAATPAWAWHINGQVFCDSNGNHVIDGGDTTLDGVGVLLTSLTASPGTSPKAFFNFMPLREMLWMRMRWKRPCTVRIASNLALRRANDRRSESGLSIEGNCRT